MGAHRHRIIRQRSSRRRGSIKFADSASSVGDDESCSTIGSVADTLSVSAPNGTDGGGLTPGTLMRHPSASLSSGGSGMGRENSRGRAGATSNAEEGVPPPPAYHPDADCSESIGFAGRLSSSHEVLLSYRLNLPQVCMCGRIFWHEERLGDRAKMVCW